MKNMIERILTFLFGQINPHTAQALNETLAAKAIADAEEELARLEAEEDKKAAEEAARITDIAQPLVDAATRKLTKAVVIIAQESGINWSDVTETARLGGSKKTALGLRKNDEANELLQKAHDKKEEAENLLNEAAALYEAADLFTPPTPPTTNSN